MSSAVSDKPATRRSSATLLPDLDSRQNLDRFIDSFYARLLRDPELAPIFFNTPDFDLQQHLPRIRQYWAKMLFGHAGYRRHTMQIHRQVHQRRSLGGAEFVRWLTLFEASLDGAFCGPGAERARSLARRIAANMHRGLAQIEPTAVTRR